MTKRISELPATGGVADTDEFEINQAGASRKATRGQIVEGLASAAHQHDLVDITDAGALAALDSVGIAEIDAAAYASQAEAVAGADNAKVMTALRTAEAIAAQAAAPEHQHGLADITDAGALAALDAIRTAEIDPSAYATQSDAAEGIDGTRIMTAARDRRGDRGKGGGAAAPARSRRHRRCRRAGGAGRRRHRRDRGRSLRIAERAVAGTDNTKIMTALRTAEAIAAHPAGEHQHDLADISDAGALAALDKVGAAEIDAAAFASQSEAVAGTGETKIMTALRTAEAIAAQAAAPEHQHDLADIADAGALAALDAVGTAEIAGRGLRLAERSRGRHRQHQDHDGAAHGRRRSRRIRPASISTSSPTSPMPARWRRWMRSAPPRSMPAAYASQSEAVAGTDDAKLMTALRTAEAIAAQAVAPEHQHTLADITDAGALAALDTIRPTEIDPSAYATQADAAAGIDGTRIMTAVRTAEAIAAQAAPQEHQHGIADITDVGALAALDQVGAGEIETNAVNSDKIQASAVTAVKLANNAVTQAKIENGAVVADKIASSAVITSKLANAAVTQEKIADGAVGASKLQPGIPIDMQDAVLSRSRAARLCGDQPLARDQLGNADPGPRDRQRVRGHLDAERHFSNSCSSARVRSRRIMLDNPKTRCDRGANAAWPSAVKWAGGAPPPITSAADAVDVYALITRDGGATWFGFPGGQDFS